MSTVVSPVTQTADTAVKRVSTKGASLSEAEANGRESRPVVIAMIEANVPSARREGA